MLDPKAELDMLRSYWIGKRVMVKGPLEVAVVVGVFTGAEYGSVHRRAVPVFDAVYEKHIEEHRDLQNCPSMRREENRGMPAGYYRFQLRYSDIAEELPSV